MSDNLDLQPLAKLAAKSGAAWSDKGHKPALGGSAAMRNRCFDGFMKIFMADDAKPASFASKNRQKASPSDTQKAGGASSSEQAASPRARQSEDAEETDDPVSVEDTLSDEEIAEAAAEAARLILSLMFPGMVPADSAGPPPSMAQLSQMLLTRNGGAGGDASLGAGGLSAGEAQTGIAAANASAEMNEAGVAAELERLLQGVPATVLEQALKTAAQGMGVSYSALQQAAEFQKLAAALGMEVVSKSESGAGPARLLAELELAGMRQNSGAGAAESAADPAATSAGADEDAALAGFFKEFLRGNASASGADAEAALAGDAGELLDGFQSWLQTKADATVNSQLSGDRGLLAQALVSALSRAAGEARAEGAGGEDADMFSWFKNNLETALLSKPAAADGAPAPANSAEPPRESSMLDQIRNVERVAEALRMSSRGGIKNLTLQLSPPELGKVMLRVEARDGQIQALLKVESREAAAQLGANLQQLRDNLRAQGIDLGMLEIRHQAGDPGAGFGAGQGGHGHTHPDREPGGRTHGGAGGDDDSPVDPALASATAAAGPGELNLFA